MYIKHYTLVALLSVAFQFTQCEESCQMGAINIVKSESANKVIEIRTMDDLNTHKKAGKPLIVKFYADWCNPCKEMKEPFENLAKEYSNVIFIGVNADMAPKIAQEHNIEGYPTLLFFDKNGEKLFARIGGITKGALSDLVERLSKGTLQKQEVTTEKVSDDEPKAEPKKTPQSKTPAKKAAPQKKVAQPRKAAPQKKSQPNEIVRKGPGGKRIRYVAVEEDEE